MLILLALVLCALAVCGVAWFERCYSPERAYKEGFLHGYSKAEADFTDLLNQWAIGQATPQAMRAKLAIILALLRDGSS